MIDYEEERNSEIQVLESIFPAELKVVSDDKLSIRVEPEVQSSSVSYVLLLHVTYTPKYPDEIPEIAVTCEEGDLTETEEHELVMGLIAAANDSLGMSMVYTLTQFLRDSLAELLKERAIRLEAEESEKARIAEEAIAIKTAGTKVTKASFLEWKVKFEKEMKEQRTKEEQERLKALPIKEREDAKKNLAKLSGRQLFERDTTLISSDSTFDDEGAVEVDRSMYERRENLSDDDEGESEETGRKLRNLDLSSDSE